MPGPLLGAGLAAGGDLLGGLIGSDAAHDAAAAQLRGTREANNLYGSNYLTSLGLQEPWRAGGQAALNQILATFGLPQQAYQSGVGLAQQNMAAGQNANTRLGAEAVIKLLKQGKTVKEISQMGILKTKSKIPKELAKYGLSAKQIAMLQAGPLYSQPGGGQGQAGKMKAPPSFIESPDYEFVRDEGQRDIGNSFAARGGAFSGNALRGLTEFNQGHASGEFDKFLDRRFRLAGFGSQATQNQQQAGSQYAYQGGNAMMNAGDARASGIANQGNIWGNALSGAANAFGNYYGQPSQYDQYMAAGQQGWGRYDPYGEPQ